MLQSINYTPGLAGSGYKIWSDSSGTHLEVDYATFRKKATFFEVIIQQAEHVGGIKIYSPASLVVSDVVEVDIGYKCYFDTKEGAVPNTFTVKDQARCQRFNLGNTKAKYYWRLVEEVGADYIILSKTDKDSGSDIPEVGDQISQFGHRTDSSRQNPMLITTIGELSPRIEFYQGVNSYNLTGKLMTVVGMHDPGDGSGPQMGVYTINGRFEGNMVIKKGSAGLENLSEWADKEAAINKSQETADIALSEVIAAWNSISEASKLIEQNQLDIQQLSESLAAINDDDILTYAEKSSLRTEWEKINGKPSLSEGGEVGSYFTTMKMVEDIGYNQGQQIHLVFGDVILDFNGARLIYTHTGIEEFTLAYRNLQDYLVSVRIYDSKITENFSRSKASELLTDYYDKQAALLNMAEKYYALTAASDAIDKFITETYSPALQEIRNSIDKKSETFRQTTDPSTEWKAEDKDSHLNDIWWNTSSETISGIKPGATAIYVKSGNTYKWDPAPIPQELFDSIDGKAQIFTDKPHLPYSKNDIWIVSEADVTSKFTTYKAGSVLTAKISSEIFNSSHWREKVRYTDDTLAGEVKSSLQTLKGEIEAKDEMIDQALYELEELAKSKASQDEYDAKVKEINDLIKGIDSDIEQLNKNATQLAQDISTAQEAADNAQEQLDNWSADDKISQPEKISIEDEKRFIESDKTSIEANATEYAVTADKSYTEYISAFTAYQSALQSIITAFSETNLTYVSIPEDFADKQTTFYTKRTVILNKIATAARTVAKIGEDAANSIKDKVWNTDIATTKEELQKNLNDIEKKAQEDSQAAQTAADNAQKVADDAQSSADSASKKAEDAQTAADNAQKAADDAQSTADTAQEAADNAQKTADSAQETASTAKSNFDTLNEDGWITKLEQNSVKDEIAFIVADKADIDIQKSRYNLPTENNSEYNAYLVAYNLYYADLQTNIINKLKESFRTPTPANFSAHQTTFYTKRTAILNKIAEASKKAADDAQSSADDAQTAADNAQKAANDAQKAADDAQSTADSAQEAADNAQKAADNVDKKADQIQALVKKLEESKIGSDEWLAAKKELEDLIGTKVNQTDYNAQVSAFNTAISNAQTAATNAQSTANTAKVAAQNALSSAKTANDLLGDISSDNKLAPSEKQELALNFSSIENEYDENINLADTYNINHNSYTAAHNALSTLISPLLQDLTTTSSCNGVQIRTAFATYYEAKTQLLNSISIKAKEASDLANEHLQKLDSMLNNINSDIVLDRSEKRAIRTQWEAIHGAANLGDFTSEGSYHNALHLYERAGIDKNEYTASFLTYNGSRLLYKNNNIYFRDGIKIWMNHLQTAYNNLKDYLTHIHLYEENETLYFNRVEFSQILTTYYAAEYYITNQVQIQKSENLQKLISDIEYLKEAFPNNIEADLFIAKLMAVASEDTSNNEIKAILNGSLVGADNVYGRLILAAGIPPTSLAGSSDLADRIKEALSRIYESGRLYSEEGVFKNVTITQEMITRTIDDSNSNTSSIANISGIYILTNNDFSKKKIHEINLIGVFPLDIVYNKTTVGSPNIIKIFSRTLRINATNCIPGVVYTIILTLTHVGQQECLHGTGVQGTCFLPLDRLIGFIKISISASGTKEDGTSWNDTYINNEYNGLSGHKLAQIPSYHLHMVSRVEETTNTLGRTSSIQFIVTPSYKVRIISFSSEDSGPLSDYKNFSDE